MLAWVSAAVAASISAHSGLATVAGWPPAERCPGAISVADAKNDTRSWTTPPPPGPPVIPPSADLRRFELRATAAGVCVRWTTAAPVPLGTVLVFIAFSPFVRESNGALVAYTFGVNLEIRNNDALATFGVDHLGSPTQTPHVMDVRVGRTGSTVSAFISDAELNRIPTREQGRPPFPYRAFTFEVRVISAPDSKGYSRADFWPQEGGDGEAGYIDGRLCAKPCKDHRFYP